MTTDDLDVYLAIAKRDEIIVELTTRIASQAAEIAALKAAMRASFDEHGSAPTDCDCERCTLLAQLLGYLPIDYLNVNDGQPS